MSRRVTWEGLENYGGGNFTHERRGAINWFIHNFCVHCEKRTIKGTTQCPDCHLKVRTLPRKPIKPVEMRALYKKAQDKAAALLKAEGWILPPAKVSAK